MRIKKFGSGSAIQLTSFNGWTIKQDGSGDLGFFNTIGNEVLSLQNVGFTFIQTLGTIQFAAKFITYANISTAGLGLPPIYAAYSTIGNAALVSNAINYTPPATAGTYRISCYVNVRTAAAVNMTVTVAYTDGAGVARSETLPLHQQASTTTVLNMNNTAARFVGYILFQIDNSATAITLSTTGTTMTVYDLAATLEQLA